MLILHGPLDFRIFGRIDKVDFVFLVVGGVGGVVLVYRIGSGGGIFLVRKSLDGQVSFEVILDREIGNFISSIGKLPLSVPSLCALLGLLLVVNVHASDTQSSSGNGPHEGSLLSVRASSLDLLHGLLDLFILDGIHKIKGFSTLRTLGLNVVVKMAQIFARILIISNLDKGDGKWAGAIFLGESF